MTSETETSDIALMIDNETLDLVPGSFITQVGICVANLRTREYLVQPVNFWMTQEGQKGRSFDQGTLAFWMDQPDHVRKGVFAPPEGMGRTHPDVLFRYMEGLVNDYPGLTVWAAPGMFDLSMLTSLWGRKPWSYKQERDMSTLYRIFDPDKAMGPPENEAAHDAAADAHWQMEYLFRLTHHIRYCVESGRLAYLAEQAALDRGG